MLLTILLTIHILVAIALIGVVLMQRSEGGALGMGGGPSGFMTARGAGDLLTRTTWILFAVFLALCVALTLLGARAKNASSLHIDKIDPNTLGAPPPGTQAPPTGAVPVPQGQLPGAAPGATGLPGALTAPAPALRNPGATPPATTPAAPATKAPAGEPAKK